MKYTNTANNKVKGKEIVINNTTTKEIVNNISTLLEENYIFSNTAKKMGEYIKEKFDAGSYESINDPSHFADMLTSDLQEISKDNHIRVRFTPGIKKEFEEAEKNREQAEQEAIEEAKKDNFGFSRIERLGGNIGYIDLRGFSFAEYGKGTVTSAMGFIENCDAVILDLRQNGGGSPEMVQLICSYFFDDTPVHLNSLYYRPDDTTKEFWTLKDIQGKKMPDMDLYILTSGGTFSAAEECTYNLKNLKRAMIIGETTGGGAHPGGFMAINDCMGIFVPTGRAINPITKTNWEGTGVKPDIEIPQDKALLKAQIVALEKIKSKSSTESTMKYNFALDRLNAMMEPHILEAPGMREYEGQYDTRSILIEDGNLYHKRGGRPKMKMIPLSKDKFGFDEVNNIALHFDRKDTGNISSVTFVYDDGDTHKSLKSN